MNDIDVAGLAGQTGILVGQSGVGKSSLLNALVPAAERATASLSTSSAGRLGLLKTHGHLRQDRSPSDAQADPA